VLGDRPDRPEFIETVTKRGYRFVAPVTDETNSPDLPIPDAIQELVGPETTLAKQGSFGVQDALRKLAIPGALVVIAAAAP